MPNNEIEELASNLKELSIKNLETYQEDAKYLISKGYRKQSAEPIKCEYCNKPMERLYFCPNHPPKPIENTPTKPINNEDSLPCEEVVAGSSEMASPVNEEIDRKWPSKCEITSDTESLTWRSGYQSGYNACHDAFMKVIKSSPELCPHGCGFNFTPLKDLNNYENFLKESPKEQIPNFNNLCEIIFKSQKVQSLNPDTVTLIAQAILNHIKKINGVE